jgi:hypothetical protein
VPAARARWYALDLTERERDDLSDDAATLCQLRLRIAHREARTEALGLAMVVLDVRRDHRRAQLKAALDGHARRCAS